MYYNYGFDFVLLHIISWIIIITLIVWIVRLATHSSGPRGTRWMHPHNNDALNILRERFAKGEISKEEFDERKKALLE